MNLSLVSRLLVLTVFFSQLFCGITVSPVRAAMKRRIAILPFEYGAVSSEVGTYDVGKGITSLLVTKLVNDGTYSVVERQMLDSILKEQNLSVSDRADPSTACKIGKLLSVDAIVVGTVTQFGFETKTAKVGGLARLGTSFIPYGGGYGAMGLGAVGVRKSRAQVAVDARLIDINTSEILGAVHGTGESKRSGVALFSGIGPDFESSGFATTIAGEATLAAVDELGNMLTALAAKIPDNQSIAAANVAGRIADVTGSQVIINIGKINGIAIGDNLRVERIYKTVKDPITGKVLKELNNTIAVITVSEADNDSATAIITKGSGVQVGDSVSKVTTAVSAIVLSPMSSAGSVSSAPTPTVLTANPVKKRSK